MKIYKKIMLVISVILVGIVFTVLIRTFMLSTKQISVAMAEQTKINEDSAIDHLSKGIQIRTISFEDPSKNDFNKLILIRDFIATQYPFIHKNLIRRIINEYSLLYEWKGTNPGKKPFILLAHMDVVPESEERWKVDPFEGRVLDGFIWGRGAIDDKGSLFAILEAVEHLLKAGFTPERTIFLAFGHDEEGGATGGMNGARRIAEHLKNQGVRAEFVLDEGSTIVDEKLSPVKGKRLAVVGVAEKGFVTLRITATGESGHSSMPPKDTAIGLLAKAIAALDKNKMPSSLNGVIGLSFEYLGPEMPFFQKLIFANRWLFGRWVMSALEGKSATAAMLHTTVAPTMIQGGTKVSALPTTASVVVNFRIIPGETSQEVVKHVKGTFSDPRIAVEPFGMAVHEPSPISRCESQSFRAVNRSIREVFPDVIVAPGLVLGRTDSIYYREVAEDIYRFAPYVYGPEELKQVHGLDERISVDSYLRMIQFYIRFIQNSAGNIN
jgi:carboxypeptidase PM20D1